MLTANLKEAMTRVANRMATMTSILCTEDAARLSLRTLRTADAGANKCYD